MTEFCRVRSTPSAMGKTRLDQSERFLAIRNRSWEKREGARIP